MSCRIADQASAVELVAWPSANAPSTHGKGKTPPASATPRREEVPDARKSAELQQALQLELAQTRQTSFDDGFRKGREEAAADIKDTNDRMAHIVADLTALKRRIRSEAESDVVKLSLAIAKRILHREMNADPESIQGLVHAGLSKLHNREVSRLRVAPSAVNQVQSALEKAGALASVSVVADSKMRNGDIIFETPFGELDASVETQLQEIERGFVDRLGI